MSFYGNSRNDEIRLSKFGLCCNGHSFAADVDGLFSDSQGQGENGFLFLSKAMEMVLFKSHYSLFLLRLHIVVIVDRIQS